MGGGIDSFEDIERLLGAGADKVSINSAAIKNPEIIDRITNAFGSQFAYVPLTHSSTAQTGLLYQRRTGENSIEVVGLG